MLRRIALIALATACGWPSLAAQQRTDLVAGVAAHDGGAPIADADVVIVDLDKLTHTDSLGQATILGVPRGEHRVRVRKIGFAAADVTLMFQGDTVGPVFFLDRSAAALDTVRTIMPAIADQMREFEQRRAMGLGRFLTVADLAKEGTRDFDLVAETHFPGLTIQTDGEGKPHIMSTRGSCGRDPGMGHSPMPTLSQRNGGPGGGGAGGGSGSSAGSTSGGGFDNCTPGTACDVLIYLDGMSLGYGDEALDLIRTWDLAGVEYYTGAEIPVRYRVSGTGCGLLLLWSKPG